MIYKKTMRKVVRKLYTAEVVCKTSGYVTVPHLRGHLYGVWDMLHKTSKKTMNFVREARREFEMYVKAANCDADITGNMWSFLTGVADEIGVEVEEMRRLGDEQWK